MDFENFISHNPNVSAKNSWFYNVTEVKAGYSAILNQNYLAFWTIHCTAIFLIVTSIISCIIVTVSILTRATKGKLDFSDRFPLYLSIGDFLWGVSHLADHLVLITQRIYPNQTAATFLSINLWFFLGYQQLMHATLATYIYIKVVHTKSINLGRCEWKLHALCIGVMLLSIAVFLFLRSFGCTGYWFLHNVDSTSGRVMAFYIATCGSVQALCTTCGYSAIKKTIDKQNKLVLDHKDKSATITRLQPRHSTATQCLTTFVWISLALYWPLALAYWAFSIQICLNVLEPLTILLIVIIANSSGWANAMGYFYNKKVKAARAAKNSDSGPNQSTVSSSSNTK